MVPIASILPRQAVLHQDLCNIQMHVTGNLCHLGETQLKTDVPIRFNEMTGQFSPIFHGAYVYKDAILCHMLGLTFNLWNHEPVYKRSSLMFYTRSDIFDSDNLKIIPTMKERSNFKGDTAVISVDSFNEQAQYRVFYLLKNDNTERKGEMLGKRLLKIQGLTGSWPHCDYQ